MKANFNQINGAIASRNAAICLYLLHGPDESGAQDIAARLARSLGPGVERLDLEPVILKKNPARLADEAASLSLFGVARYIRVMGAGEEIAEAVSLLLRAKQSGNPVVIIAPALKGTSKLVKLVQSAPGAMSFSCYLPEGGDADRLVTAIAREQGLRTTGTTAQRLAMASGGDRAVMTRELEKLALYLDAAPERPRDLDEAALDAIGADLHDAETARAVEAAIEGGMKQLAIELACLNEAGVSPIPLLRQLARRLLALAELQGDMEAGTTVETLLERVFFRERASTTRALRLWTSSRIVEALNRLRAAERGLMASATAGTVLCDAAVVAVGRTAMVAANQMRSPVNR